MVYFFQKAVILLVIPFLAVVALAFNAVGAGLRFGLALAGWELAWPPVLVDGLEADAPGAIMPRSRRTVKRPKCYSR